MLSSLTIKLLVLISTLGTAVIILKRSTIQKEEKEKIVIEEKEEIKNKRDDRKSYYEFLKSKKFKLSINSDGEEGS